VARALIVGCGCRGRELATALLERGWQVRGTTREAQNVAAIEAAGIEAAVADPDRVGTILDQIADVTVVYWLLGSAEGDPAAVAALHGPRLERVLEVIVDTPVRGFVYEGRGTVADECLQGGATLVRDAGARWRIPVAATEADPGDVPDWRARMLACALELTGAG
jgi:nucleoside-diphosphate-sugar epimerase